MEIGFWWKQWCDARVRQAGARRTDIRTSVLQAVMEQSYGNKTFYTENRKIDFLRTISHELKTPIAAANALVEWMLYEIPPYDRDQGRYLQQCQILLEQAVALPPPCGKPAAADREGIYKL